MGPIAKATLNLWTTDATCQHIYSPDHSHLSWFQDNNLSPSHLTSC